MFLQKNKYNFSKSEESAFQSHIEPEKVTNMRIMAFMGVALYLVFSIVDIWALPSALSQAFLIRSTVVLGLVLSYALTYSHLFIKYYDYFIPIPYLLAALGIELMILISSPEDYASNVYFAGLMLVIMILFAWAHLKIINLVITSAVIIVMYAGIEIQNHGSEAKEILPILLPNLFFIIGAAIIGSVTQLIRNSYLRQNFLLQKSLKEAYDEKAEEAKDNAYMANHDALTDLPNRRYMTELLEKSLQVAKKKDKVLILMFMDLNGFKQVNDIYGHAVGDEVLIIVAKRLELAIRAGDYLSRLGGDEFLLGLMMDKDNLKEVENMSEKFITLISQPMNIDGLSIKIGASIGIAAYPIHGNNINVLMDIADKKMYQAKKGISENNRYSYGEFNQKEQEPVVIFPGKSNKNSK